MSYDLVFLRREPGQSWEDAFAARETDVDDTATSLRPLDDTERAQWEQLVARARSLLGDVETHEDDPMSRELSSAATGIRLSFAADEATISVEDSATSGSALEVMSKVYALAGAVEQVTRLEGYDPQLDEPVSDAADTSPRRPLPTAADARAGDDEDELRTPGRPAPARPDVVGARGVLAPPPSPRRRPWWRFWDRGDAGR